MADLPSTGSTAHRLFQNKVAMPVGLQLQSGRSGCDTAPTGGDRMDSNYVILCGVMWCRFGQQDAGRALLRAGDSTDPDVRAFAWAMLAKGARRFKG